MFVRICEGSGVEGMEYFGGLDLGCLFVFGVCMCGGDKVGLECWSWLVYLVVYLDNIESSFF